MQITEPNTIDHQVEGMEMETNKSLGDYFIAIISIILKNYYVILLLPSYKIIIYFYSCI